MAHGRAPNSIKNPLEHLFELLRTKPPKKRSELKLFNTQVTKDISRIKLLRINNVRKDYGVGFKFSAETQITLLMLAAANGHRYAVKKLLKKGASPDLDSELGNAAMFAAENGQIECLEILLMHGSNPNFVSISEQLSTTATPLGCAIYADYHEDLRPNSYEIYLTSIKLLLRHGAKLFDSNDATEIEDVNVLKLLNLPLPTIKSSRQQNYFPTLFHKPNQIAKAEKLQDKKNEPSLKDNEKPASCSPCWPFRRIH